MLSFSGIDKYCEIFNKILRRGEPPGIELFCPRKALNGRKQILKRLFYFRELRRRDRKLFFRRQSADLL